LEKPDWEIKNQNWKIKIGKLKMEMSMESEWNRNGTGMEPKWNWNGTGMEPEWKIGNWKTEIEK
jgi:hypothetical protein